jgi:lauroyl/myristoyl acyltransferase
MVEDFAPAAPEAREAAMFEALVDTARRRQQAAFERSSLPPRFLLDSAQSMAAHTAMSEERMHDSLALMALWHLYLQFALGARTWDFAAVREHMPWSYERVREALVRMEWRPQVVSTVFHMAAFPLVCVLIGAVWRDMHGGPLHLLVANRNMAWFRTEKNRWVRSAVEVVSTDPGGLRRLLAGLRDGSVRRLLILADGPQAPGTPGARALDGVSSALAIRTGLLAKIHTLGIPLAPFKHEWDANRLLVTHCAPLDPATLSETETIDAMVRHVEDLLRRHPEQWLNWTAASIRT